MTNGVDHIATATETATPAITEQTNLSNEELKPSFLLRVFACVYGCFSNRVASFFLSLFVVIGSYFLDCYIKEPTYLAGSGAIVAGLGLILTIKHSYLCNLDSATKLIQKYDNVFSLVESDWNSTAKQRQALSKALDEGLGITLVLLGAFVTFLSPTIPLISLCNNTLG